MKRMFSSTFYIFSPRSLLKVAIFLERLSTYYGGPQVRQTDVNSLNSVRAFRVHAHFMIVVQSITFEAQSLLL